MLNVHHDTKTTTAAPEKEKEIVSVPVVPLNGAAEEAAAAVLTNGHELHEELEEVVEVEVAEDTRVVVVERVIEILKDTSKSENVIHLVKEIREEVMPVRKSAGDEEVKILVVMEKKDEIVSNGAEVQKETQTDIVHVIISFMFFFFNKKIKPSFWQTMLNKININIMMSNRDYS